MANTKSAEKRIRMSAVRRLRNRYQLTTTRTFVKRLRNAKTKAEATEMLPKVISLIDKCAKRSIYHKNTASRMKSRLTRHANAL